MKKLDYFKELDRLAKNAHETVGLVCEWGSDVKSRGEKERRLSVLRLDCDKTVRVIEDALFADFLPPMQRDGIAVLAHSLWQLNERAAEHGDVIAYSRSQGSEEEHFCVELARILVQSTAILKDIRTTKLMPQRTEFYENFRKASEAHGKYLVRINSGALPRSCMSLSVSYDRLRAELSRCFDTLVEVMLENI